MSCSPGRRAGSEIRPAGADRVHGDRARSLGTMGFECDLTEEYASANGHTRLVDLTTKPGPLKAPLDKIHPLPFPGLNIDNLPFFAIIAACAQGSTLIHDWVYENRAIYLTELTTRRQGPP